MVSKFIQFFKRYWVFILLATVASGFFVLRLVQKGQPPPPPRVTSEPSLIEPKIDGIKIPSNAKLALANFSFPSQLKTYQGQESKISSDKAIKIAQEFNFSQPPQKSEDVFLGTFYAWSSKPHFLSISLDSSKIEYGLDLYQTQLLLQGVLPSPETAKTTLKNLLTKLDLTPEFEIKWQKEEYLVQDHYFSPTSSPEEADFIKVGFNPSLDRYQLVSLNPTEPLVSLTLGKDGEIIRFQSQIYFSKFDSQETYTLKTKEEVQKSLTREGRIVYASTLEKTTKEPEISQASFDKVQLAYFQEAEKTSVIQPIFILSGQGTLADGEVIEIIACLPAISSEYLKSSQEHFKL